MSDRVGGSVGVSTEGHAASAHAAHEDGCQWCPLCQFVTVLGPDHPELAGRVVQAGAALVAVARAVVDLLDGAGAGSQSADAASPRVRHIDLSGR